MMVRAMPQVTVRLFAGLRERAGADRVELDLPEGATAADVLRAMDLGDRDCVVAVNRGYADATTPVGEGVEVDVEASVVVYRFRHGHQDPFIGRYRYTLVRYTAGNEARSPSCRL